MSWHRFFHRQHSDIELQQELNFYLEEETAENIARGMQSDEARRQARIKLGSQQQAREELWRQNTIGVIENVWRDIRYAARILRRSRGFSLIAVLVMALGIGANVALFTVVRSVLLKPLPFPNPDRLMAVYENTSDQFPYNTVAGGIFAEWQKLNHSFSDLVLMGEEDFNLGGAGGELPEKVRGINCTWNFLTTLGIEPALGRDFTAADDQPSANATVLMSWSLWKRRFGGDPSVLNQTIHLNGQLYTVIGILPAWFAYPDSSTQLWTPIHHDKPASFINQLDGHNFTAIGRLKSDVTPGQGLTDLSLITRRLHDQHLDNPFVRRAANSRPLLEDMVGEIKRPLYVLLAATGCVLLIACLNVANLLVARATARRKELAIRAALGGGRLRLLRERLMESTLLAAAGGAAGVALAFGAVQWLVHTRQDFSRVEAIHIDGEVAAFTAGLVVLSAVFAGLIASFSAADGQLLTALQDASRGSSAGHGRTRLRRSLLTAEVGLTVVLLVSAGLLLMSYARLRSADLGCTTKNVLTMNLDLFGKRYNEPAQLASFYAALLTRVRSIPGVEAAAFVAAVPGQGYWCDGAFRIAEHPPLPQGKGQFAIYRWSDPGYFAAMGIPVLQGHSFDANRRLDQANQAVISVEFAHQYFPGENPLGKHLRFGGKNYEIAGIVGDTRYSLSELPRPMQYFPLFDGHQNNGELVIRSSHDVEQLALPVQRIVGELDHDLPVSDVLTMDQLLGRSTLDANFNTTLLVGFALLSLTLAAVGIFGLLSYIVAQRTSEIGIRIALGAQRKQVLRKILLDGLRPALFGLVFGLAASSAATRLLRSMLYETAPLDPSVFAAVAGVLLLVAMLACAVPAWRASRTNPMQALRAE